MTDLSLPDVQEPEPPEDKLDRLIKRRSDYWMKVQGLAKPVTRDEANRIATREIATRMQDAPEIADPYAKYLVGESQEYPFAKQEAPIKQGPPAYAHPIQKAVYDYLVDPVNTAVTAVPQFALNLGFGALNKVGFDVQAPDVKAGVASLYRWVGSGMQQPLAKVYGQTKEMMTEADVQQSFAADVLDFAGRTVGNIGGFARSTTFKAASGAGSFVAKWAAKMFGKELPGWAAKAAGASAGFGTVEGLQAQPGKGLEAAAWGAAMGPVYKSFNYLGKLAFSSVLAGGAKGLGTTKPAVEAALKDWAVKNQIYPLSGEATPKYLARALSGWVDAGAPGVDVPVRKLIAYGFQGGIENLGFSAIDAEFRKNVYEAIKRKDPEASAAALAQLAGGALGMGLLHASMRLEDIPRWQRKQVTPSGEPPPPPPAAPPQEPAPPGTKLLPATAEGYQAKVKAMQEAAGSEAQQAMPETEPDMTGGGYGTETKQAKRSLQAPETQRAVGQQGTITTTQEAVAAYDRAMLERMGWEQAQEPQEPQGEIKTQQPPVKVPEHFPATQIPPELGAVEVQKPIRVQIPDSPYWFDLHGDMATPSPKLAKALGMEVRPYPARDLQHAVMVAHLHSTLVSKAMLPGTEISVADSQHAEAGTEEQAGTIRAQRFGELLEKPLAPGAKFKPTESVPARGKDDISQQQKAVVRGLQDTLQHVDMPPESQLLLNGSIDVLDTVAAENDPSVAETLQAMPALADGINRGDPKAIQALAEMLTVKEPKVAIGDMAKAAEAEKPVPSRPEGVEQEKPARPTLEGGEEPSSETGFRLLEDTGKSIFDVPDAEREAFMAERRKEIAQQQAEMPRKAALRNLDINIEGSALMGHVDIPASERKIAEDVLGKDFVDKYVAENMPVLSRRVQERREAEKNEFYKKAEGLGPSEAMSGISPKQLGKELLRLVKGITEGVDESRIGAYYSSLIERVRQRGKGSEYAGKVAEMGHEADTKARAYAGRMYQAGLRQFEKDYAKPVPEAERIVTDPYGGSSEVFAAGMDEPRARHFGIKREEQSPELQEMFNRAHDIVRVPRQVAGEIGLTREGEKIEDNPDVWRLPYDFVPEMRDAINRKKGPLWDALVNWTEKVHGYTPNETAEKFTEGRRLMTEDPVEHKRIIPFLPTGLEVPGRGRVRIMEGRPFEAISRLARHSSTVLGGRAVFNELPAEGAPALEPDNPLYVPKSAQGVVDKLKAEGQPEAALAAARMIRALHGLEPFPEKQVNPRALPGSKSYQLAQIGSALLTLVKGGRLSMGFINNMFELVGHTTHLGPDRLIKSALRFGAALVSGNLSDFTQPLLDGGYLKIDPGNRRVAGDTGIESFGNATKKLARMMTKPLDWLQHFVEISVADAARDAATEMERGNGGAADTSMLRAMGFTAEQAKRMVAGQGTPDEYARYRTHAVSTVAGGHSMTSAEKSELGQSRKFNNWIWFQNYFMQRARIMRAYAQELGDAETPGQRAAVGAKIVAFMAANAAAGSLVQILRKYLHGETVYDWMREAQENPATAMTSILWSNLFGAGGQVFAEIASDVFGKGTQVTKEDVALAGMRLLGPVDAVIEHSMFLLSLGHVDIAGYENKSWLEKVGTYLKRQVPAVRAVNDGLFGIAIEGLTRENPELGNAFQANNRWKTLNKPDENKSRQANDVEWLDSMRSVVDRVRAGDNWTDPDLMDAIEKAVLAKQAQGEAAGVSVSTKQAKESVAASLRLRKQLPSPRDKEWTIEQRESQARYLGEQHMALLQAYDDTLEYLARRIAPKQYR